MPTRECPVEYVIRLVSPLVSGNAIAGPQSVTTQLPNVGVSSTGMATVSTLSAFAATSETIQIDVRSASYSETHRLRDAALAALLSGGRFDALVTIADQTSPNATEDGAVIHRSVITCTVGT